MWTVEALAADLAAGRTTSRALVETALERIAEPSGEGARAFMRVYADVARADAEHADRLRKSGIVRSVVDGLPISVKDLFDVGGDVTRAGSKLLADAPAAPADAPAVARLRAAGAVIVGRTNMVEFAFGAVGTNPHYGTPKNPWDRPRADSSGASIGGRVPGGSSSGAAVSVADGMCVMGLGTDTRGSIRQPAALCGIAGFKPTARRVPRQGAFPLSYTLDSVGPLANTIACCAAYDAVLAGESAAALKELPARGLRLLLPRSSAIEDLDPAVAKAFDSSLAALSRAGALIEERRVPSFDQQAEYFRNGGFAAAEAYAIHRRWAARFAEYDPRVAKRMTLGKDIAAWELVELGLLREAYMKEIGALMAPFDAFLIPTAPCIAPTIAEASASDDAYFRWNSRILRNTGLGNFLDGCAATLPCHAPGEAPVGLMVCGVAMTDRHVLAAARAIEGVLQPDAEPARPPGFNIDARIARRRFERAANSYAHASRLEAEIGARMLERLAYVKLAPRRVLDAGSGPVRDARALAKRYRKADVLALDFSRAMLHAGRPRLRFFQRRPPKPVCADMVRLPLASTTIGLLWSNMALHWTAEPLAAMREFYRVLSIEGLLMFSTLGPDTLAELRSAAGPARVHAFADMHDLGDMLVAAGFADPVMDTERITMVYADGEALLADLRASGQTCALAAAAGGPRRGLSGRRFRAALVDGLAAQRRDGKLSVSYEVVYGHAWKAAPRQAADGRAIVQFERRR